MVKRNSYKIPVALLEYLCKEKCLKELRLYVLFQFYSDGHLYYNSKTIKTIVKKHYNCRRTFRNHYLKLLKLGFIWEYKDTKRIQLIPIKKIFKRLDLVGRSAVLVEKECLDHFDTFVFATINTSLYKKMEYSRRIQKGRRGSQLEQKMADSYYLENLFLSMSYIGITINKMVEITGLSRSSVIKHKKLSQKKDYLHFEKRYKSFDFKEGKYYFLKAFPYLANKVLFGNGRIHIQLPDKITCENIHLKKYAFLY